MDYSSLYDDALYKCHVYKVFNFIIFNHDIDVFLHRHRIGDLDFLYSRRTDSWEIRIHFSCF